MAEEENIVAMAQRKRLIWRAHPLIFVNDCLRISKIDRDFEISEQQKQALRAVGHFYRSRYKTWEIDHGRKPEDDGWKPMNEDELGVVDKIGISIMAGRGVGKSAFMAWIIIWFLVNFEEARIVCTSTKQDQLKTVIWAGVSQWLHAKLPTGENAFLMHDFIKVTGEKITFDENKVFEKMQPRFAKMAICQKNSNVAEQQATLSGDHSPNMLILADESAGIPDPVFEPLERTMTGKFNICIQTFNPIKNSGYAHDSHYGPLAKKWVKLNWNAEESELVSRKSIEQAKEEYGEDSDKYRVNILGLPPKGGEDVLIPFEWVAEASMREREPEKTAGKRLGIDPAGPGKDKTVFVLRQGGVVLDIVKYSHLDTTEIAELAADYIVKHKIVVSYTDTIGIGQGVFDNLRRDYGALGCKHISVQVSKLAHDVERFARLRDELWWRCREWFEAYLPCIPDDRSLVNQLTDIKYTEETGKIKVEAKSIMKKRTGGSPDSADALNLTFFHREDRFSTIYRDETPYEDMHPFGGSRGDSSHSYMAV